MSRPKPFTPPAGLTILGTWTPIVGDPLLGRERDCFAEYRGGRMEIALDPALSATKQGESLMHEIVEAVNQRLELDLEHKQITALAAAITCFIRENPGRVERIARSQAFVEVCRP